MPLASPNHMVHSLAIGQLPHAFLLQDAEIKNKKEMIICFKAAPCHWK